MIKANDWKANCVINLKLPEAKSEKNIFIQRGVNKKLVKILVIVENRVWLPEEAVKMHGYPVMQVVQYSVPTCTWGPPPDILHRPPSVG